jgi:cell division protein DivIC
MMIFIVFLDFVKNYDLSCLDLCEDLMYLRNMNLLSKIKRIRLENLPDFLKNKYVITAFIFLIWISFFDQNNWFERLRNMKQLKQLEEDKQYYQAKIKEETRRLEELQTDKENLEKFAREQYLMKKENEDIFLIIEE